MDETANLSLPYIMPQQAQKYVTHNDALRDLDSIVQLAVLDRDLAAPPSTPAAGDRYIVAASPTGAWSGHAGTIAAWQDGLWLFYPPQKGWRVWIADEALLIAWNGAAWVVAGQSVNPASMVGVVATADTTNRLSVKSNAVLFANDDVTPGTGHMRAAISKASAAKDASLTFQDAFSGRALIGLTGDDHFHVKVSPDGSSWSEAIYVSNSNARVGIGTTAPDSRLTVSDNAAALPAPPTATTAHLAAADGSNARILVDSFGAGASVFTYRRAKGTAAAPSAVQSGDQLLNFGAFGYGATGYSATARIGFTGSATENWSDTAQGTSFAINTTANGTASNSTGLLLDQDGSIHFARIGTTASAANAYLDSGATNSLLRSTSSLAYKTNIEPLDASLSHALMQAKPIWYRSAAPADDPTWSWYGFGAEPVAEIDPRMVHWGYGDADFVLIASSDPDMPSTRVLKPGAVKKPQGVSYDRFVVHHHLIIKELLARVDALEAAQRPAQSK